MLFNNKCRIFIALSVQINLLLCVFNVANSYAFPQEAPPENIIKTNQKIAKFFTATDYKKVSLSPDGKHIALIRNDKGIDALIIVDVKTMKAINNIHFDKKDSVGSYYWANSERLLIFLNTKQRNEERKAYYGELYSIDIKANKGKFVFGLRSLVRRGRIKSGTGSDDYEKHFAHPRIINQLDNDRENILIATSQYKNSGMWVFKLNVYTGHIETVAKLKHKSAKVHYFQETNQLWLSTVVDKTTVQIERYDFENENWIPFQPKGASRKLSIIAPSQKSDELLVKDYCGNDTLSICLLNLKSNELSALYQIEGFDIRNILLDKTNTLFAFSYFDDYPQYKIINNQHPQAKILTEFINNFAGMNVSINWSSLTSHKMIVSIASDIQPITWYLYDQTKNKVSFVANSRKAIDALNMNKQYAFSFEARDKQLISGYVTLPASKTQSPAVILVHGGPVSRDYWGFDPEVQFLASQGYAVVQINFRGSAGFGWSFEKLGYKELGRNIQYDILDGIDYLAKQKYIDQNRLCIMGTSFGGYSAVQSSLLEPDLFKCAIALSGLYDLKLQLELEKREFSDLMGSEKIQINQSPVHSIAKLKTPLLLMHGTKDDVTPFEQVKALKEQLDKHDKEYQWHEIKKEGHGFYNAQNKSHFFHKVSEFLQQHNPSN